MSNQKHEARIKRAVIAGGGEWCGVQQSIPPQTDLVLFNSPQTGSTLALPMVPEHLFSDAEYSKRIHEKIMESDKSFQVRKVKVSKLQHIKKQLSETLEELNGIIEGR